MHSKKFLVVWLALLLIFTMACKADTANTTAPELQNDTQAAAQLPQENQPNQQPLAEENPTGSTIEEISAAPEDMDFFQQVEYGVISVGGVQANSQDEDTFGPILTLQLTNLSTEEVIVTVPCGLVFSPSDAANQRLMIVQPLEVALAAGETQSPTPYVVCIDLAASAPGYNHTYSIGTLTDNPDLLKLAECICNEELDLDPASFDGVGVQMAAWSTSIGGDFSQISENEQVTANLLGEEGGSVEEAMESFIQMVSLFGDDWLKTCDIEFETSD